MSQEMEPVTRARSVSLWASLELFKFVPKAKAVSAQLCENEITSKEQLPQIISRCPIHLCFHTVV